jgi:hypothetical protein
MSSNIQLKWNFFYLHQQIKVMVKIRDEQRINIIHLFRWVRTNSRHISSCLAEMLRISGILGRAFFERKEVEKIE